MANIINIIYLLAWFIQAVRQILTWSYWIQVKEYRLDRFFVAFKSKSGKLQLGACSIFIKLLTFTLLSFLPLNTFTFLAIVLFFYILYLDFLFLYEICQKKARKPVFTLRVKEILGITFLGLLIYFYNIQSIFINYFWIYLFAEILIITSPFLGIFLTKPLVNLTKKKEIEKVKEKLHKVKPIAIGVTGSYGKTTTKDFIYQLLVTENKVSRTPASHNTEFGLVRAILENLKKDDKYFIAEYGAYKKGEIKKLVKIVKPKIAVLTAIEPQHLELFGSIENICKAKYELFENLSKGNVAIFNIGNKSAVKLYKRALKELEGVEILTYTKKNSQDAGIVLRKYKKVGRFYQIEVKINSTVKKIKTNIKLPFLFENLLPAIMIANKAGVSWASIKKACGKLNLPENTMNIVDVRKNLTVIDDTHNLSPTAFISSIRYLGNYKDCQKIVITPGMIELGHKSEVLHEKVAEEMKKIGISGLILTKKDVYETFAKILGEKVGICDFLDNDIFKENNCKMVVLLAGRVPESIKKKFDLL